MENSILWIFFSVQFYTFKFLMNAWKFTMYFNIELYYLYFIKMVQKIVHDGA